MNGTRSSVPGTPARRDVTNQCRVCQKRFASPTACRQHEKNAKHPRKAVYACDVCSLVRLCQASYESHVRGRKHRNKLAASRTQTRVVPVEVHAPPNQVSCAICNTIVAAGNWDSHAGARRHSLNLTRQGLAEALSVTEEDKLGICIDGSAVDFGFVDGSKGRVSDSKQIRITNNGPYVAALERVKFSTTTGNIFQVVKATHRRQLNKQSNITVDINLFASRKDRGIFKNRLEFYFEIPSLRRKFAITRPLSARVGSSSDYETLRATKPYVPRERTRGYRFARYIPGIRPQALAQIEWVRKLEKFDVPEDLEAIFSRDDLRPSEILNLIRASFIYGELGSDTYAQNMQLMLWVEEERASRELNEYNMTNARLSPRGKCYELEVPGLAEKRPSVLIGDRFFVNESGSPEAPPYEGFVHQVENRVVLLHFNKKFTAKWSGGQMYDVRFDLNRLVLRRMHQAVTEPSEDNRIIFPTLSRELLQVSAASMHMISLYDSKITNNESQRRAVASILQMPPGSIPFIIYGPPGTGKTVTMVEAIRQVLARKPNARILACAPSNSAADIIVERLAEYPSVLGDVKKALFRLIAPSRPPKVASSTILKFTRVNEYGVFESPPAAELKTFRVVVSTCSTGGVPYGVGFEHGHFTHIFVDEAAQALEPEVMIPIRTMLGPDTNVILSGDVKQLGPIVRSPTARELGLGVSFIERLMNTVVYDEDRAKGRSMIKLTKNYRSHPAILEFPNAQFYKNELEACALEEISHCIAGKWDDLVERDYPILFHGVCGGDMREDPSPSYFNPDEVVVVRDYVKSLLEGTLQLESKDIGVIAPYRAQVLKLRQLLRPFAPDARVGSVEEFQGQERKVIIISTVRSSQDQVAFDIRHTLGFVANPRRFNVAVTRAQALLVVVGDPYVLSLDPMWREFINHVYLKGGYTGVELDWDPSDPVDHDEKLDEARRAQGQFDLEEVIRRAGDLEPEDDDYFEDAAAFREEN